MGTPQHDFLDSYLTLIRRCVTFCYIKNNTINCKSKDIFVNFTTISFGISLENRIFKSCYIFVS
ncbi:hypothetical protein ANACOL_01310 [Anaerotruncus colihominis DSM 17241]|uniref:Uncharacterized protein n=1 Tax=Anaerotruncus colihominis DSM 17241 TaxID=445972 RepID=B0P963_9FIRM|nr:hypothetical protein ANACOL_01310 [Anaerotruncus colihominis DSM 17241]